MPRTQPRKDRPRTRREAAPWQLRESIRRAAIVRKALPLLRAGRSMRAAALRCGEPIGNVWRYVRAFQGGGAAALVPGISTGRRSVADKVKLTKAEAIAIAALSPQGNIPAACRAYLESPDCRAELRPALTGRISLSVREAITASMKPQAAPRPAVARHSRK